MYSYKQKCKNLNNKNHDCFGCDKKGDGYYCWILNDADFRHRKNVCSFYKKRTELMGVGNEKRLL